jgi:hypothetical protein
MLRGVQLLIIGGFGLSPVDARRDLPHRGRRY